MNKIQQLASDTVIYGVSSILGRVIFVLLSKLYTNEGVLSQSENGEINILFTLSAFLMIVLGFGLETAFFRYALKEENNLKKTLSTSLIFSVLSSLSIGGLLFLFSPNISGLINQGDLTHFVQLIIVIVILDTLTSIPFGYLRATNRPIRFAAIKLGGILINVAANLFFYLLCPHVVQVGESHILYGFVDSFYNPSFGAGYAFVANIIDVVFKFILLSPIFRFARKLDVQLLKKMLRYGWPIMLVLFGAMINEVSDRFLLGWFLPFDEETNKEKIAIYSTCYKFAIMLSLFTQAFRYAGEPFFFARAKDKDAKQTYAKVLKYFTIFTLIGFLAISLNLNAIKHILIASESYYEGLKIVPILLMAYVFSGIYYNLSIWYKLTDQTRYGAIVALLGAGVTILVNAIFIPQYGYMASAYATLACFVVMTLLAYLLGQREYPVPYSVVAIVGYIVLALFIYLIFYPIISTMKEQSLLRYVVQVGGILLFVMLVLFIERKELRRIL